MESYFPVMTEQYRKKHYNKGVFARMHQNTAKISFLTYIFMGAVFVAGAYGTWWCIKSRERFSEYDLTVFGYIMTAACAIFGLVGLACLIITVRRHLRGPEGWKARCAAANNYTVEDMNVFEREALEQESRVISLVGPVAKATAGQLDGILTRNYIALTLSNETIMKLSDVSTACLVHQSVSAGNMPIDYLVVGLMGKGGLSVVGECTKESGHALIELLKDRIPELDTADDRIIESSEYEEIFASKYGKRKPLVTLVTR